MKFVSPRDSGIASARSAWMASTQIPGMPRPCFDAPGETGSGETPEQIAAREAAAKAAKEAADKAAAEAAAKVEADRKAAEEAELAKASSDKEKELLQEIQVRKRKEREAKTALEDATKRLKEFEGIDPAKVKELLAAQEKAAADAKKAEQDNLEKKGEFDRLKKMMADDFEAKIKAKDEETKTTKSALDQAQETIMKLTVGTAFSNSDFVTNETVLTPDVARQVFGTHFDVQPDGKVVAFDKPAGTKDRTMLVDSSGTPLAFEDSIKKLVETRSDKEKLLRAKGSPGAGSTTTPVRGANQQTAPDGLKGAARIAAALKGGALAKPANGV